MFKMFRSSSLRSILALLSGTAGGQVIMVLSSLALARLYTPADFGIFALFAAISLTGGNLSGGRYEVALVIPDSPQEAQAITKLAILINTAVCLAVGILVLLAVPALEGVGVLHLDLGFGMLLFYGVALALNIWLSHLIVTFRLWGTRQRRYHLIARATMLQALAISGISILLGFWSFSATGLIVGALTGRLLTAWFMGMSLFEPDERRGVLQSPRAHMRAMAKQYRNHPQHLLPSLMMGTIGMQMPVFALSICFGPTVTGYYSLAQRMISLPVSMISTTVGEVYRERIAVRYRQVGEFRATFLKTLAGLLLIGGIPLGLVYFLAPTLFRVFFGVEWVISGEYAQILIVAALFQFCLTPLDKGAVIVGATRFVFVWQAIRLAGASAVFAILYVGGIADPVLALWLFVAASVPVYVINGIANYRFSCGYTS